MFCSILICLIYYKVSSKLDKNIRFSFKSFNYELIKKNYSFLCWSLLGQSTTIFRIQGMILLFNQFFNSSILISRSISMQIANSINLVSDNLNTNYNPILVKKFHFTSPKETFELLLHTTKLSFFFCFFLALPLLVETEFILLLLFDNLTENIVFFTKLAVIDALILSSTTSLASIARAPANMKIYELSLGSIQIMIVIASCLLVIFGHVSTVVFIISITGNLIMWFVRIIITSKLISFNPFIFIKKILLFIFGASFISLVLVLTIKGYLLTSNLNSLLVIFIGFIINILMFIIFFKKYIFSILNYNK